MAKYKLIVADNDGTLVSDDRVLSERTKLALQKAHQQGVLIGMASGRDVYSLQEYARNWGLGFDFDICIGINGADLLDNINKEFHHYTYLKKGAVKAILDMMAPLDLTVQLHHDGKIYVTKIDDEVKASMKRNHTEDITVILEDTSITYDWELAKAMYRFNEERMPEVEAWVEKHPSPLYRGFKTQPMVYEFSDPSVNKGQPLIDFCKVHNIPLDEVVAFGDTTNDNEMLACCVGVCPANCSDDSKALATYVSEYTNNEDAVARFIEEYVLD